MAEPEINVVGLSNSKSNSKTNWKVVSAIIGIVVLALGVIAGIILVRQNQDIREQAACVAECPATRNRSEMTNCYGDVDSDGDHILCNLAGRIEVCGQNESNATQFCCPSVGGNWTTNLTLCSAVATATPKPTVKPTVKPTTTATGTSRATTTATGTSRATTTAKSTSASTPAATIAGSATPFPVPETGAEWPTMIGAGLGVILLIVSLGLAL